MAYISLLNWITIVSGLVAAVFWTGQVFAQTFGDCVRFANACSRGCYGEGNPDGCQSACSIGFLACIPEDGEEGGRSGEGRLIERSGCFPDTTSSTGWRLRECETFTGSSGQATRCNASDQCPAPGCGLCKCTRAPNGTSTCIEQCFRYNQAGGASPNPPRACK